jgi:DNA polymerase III subunit chi
MTQVDFYILADEKQQARLLFLCRLVEKAYKKQHRIYIHTDSEADSKAIDLLLWTFKVESFIPHHLLGDENAPAPVAIGHGNSCDDHHDVLINLCNDVPDFFSRFERCVEIVIQQPEVLESTRKHFGFYRERGYPLNTHDLRKPAK